MKALFEGFEVNKKSQFVAGLSQALISISINSKVFSCVPFKITIY